MTTSFNLAGSTQIVPGSDDFDLNLVQLDTDQIIIEDVEDFKMEYFGGERVVRITRTYPAGGENIRLDFKFGGRKTFILTFYYDKVKKEISTITQSRFNGDESAGWKTIIVDDPKVGNFIESNIESPNNSTLINIRVQNIIITDSNDIRFSINLQINQSLKSFVIPLLLSTVTWFGIGDRNDTTPLEIISTDPIPRLLLPVIQRGYFGDEFVVSTEISDEGPGPYYRVNIRVSFQDGLKTLILSFIINLGGSIDRVSSEFIGEPTAVIDIAPSDDRWAVITKAKIPRNNTTIIVDFYPLYYRGPPGSPDNKGIRVTIIQTYSTDTILGPLGMKLQLVQSSLFPTIDIAAETDSFFGRNLAQVQYTIVDDREHSPNEGIIILPSGLIQSVITNYPDSDGCYPAFTRVVKGEGKYLVTKATALSEPGNVNPVLSGIILYGTARYILSFLLYGRFCIDDLLGKNTKKFFHDLANSRYRDFLEAFQDPKIKGFDKYFKFCY